MTEYRHIYLRGNYQQDICFDKEDFIQIWNRILLAAYFTGTIILALILLSNHFHMVVMSLDVPGFMHYLRMSVTHYFNKRYGVHGTLGTRNYGNGLICDPNVDDGEDLKDAICYVMRNCLHHGVMQDFLKYAWSTVRLAFGDRKLRNDTYDWQTIPKDLAMKYLPYPNKLPEGLRMAKNGVIMPEQIIRFDLVEEIFKSKVEYFRLLFTETRREKEGKKETQEKQKKAQKREARQPAEANIKDEQITEYIKYRLEQMSNESRNAPRNIMQMNTDEKYAMAREVKRAIPECPTKVLARVLTIPESTLRGVLARSPNLSKGASR